MIAKHEALRAEITKSRTGRTRWRCPTGLREKIVEFALERKKEGVSVIRIAKELGVSESGLTRWLQRGSGRLRPVRVSEQPQRSSQLVLVSPGGYRLEGLSASSAVEILRRLG